MPRQNTSLIVALVLSVLISLTVGYFCWMYYDKTRSMEAEVAAAKDGQVRAKAELEKKNDEYLQLQRWIAGAAEKSMEELKADFDSDMDLYAKPYLPVEEEQRPWCYHELLPKLRETIQQKETELQVATLERMELEVKLENREQRQIAQVGKFQSLYSSLEQTVKNANSTYVNAVQHHDGELAKLTTYIRDYEQKANQRIQELDRNLGMTSTRLTESQEEKTRIIEEQRAMRTGTISAARETPDGMVTSVSEQLGEVWINVGYADNLQKQIKFGVYPSNGSGGTSQFGDRKGLIEVIKIEGEHTARARIVDNSLSDPILRGDIIHTTLWSPGEVKHVALAGVIDIDDDGRTDVDEVRRLIEANGGKVDCWIDASNVIQGKITPETRYLVQGDMPDELSSNELRTANTRMINKAIEFGAETKTLAGMLRELNYDPNQATGVIHYGPGGNAGTVRTSGDGVQRVSTGNNAFQSRTPPPRTSGGAF